MRSFVLVPRLLPLCILAAMVRLATLTAGAIALTAKLAGGPIGEIALHSEAVQN